MYIFDLAIYITKNSEFLNLKQHVYNIRNQRNTKIDFYRLSKTLNSHIVLALKVYNLLEPKINLYSFKEFKNKFYKWLLENPFYSLDEFFEKNEFNF